MDLHAAPVAGSSRQPADPDMTRPENAAAHHWFRFVPAHPAHIVRDCLDRLDTSAGAAALPGIADRAGYRPEAPDLSRTRPATAPRRHLREELLVLRWPG